MASTTGENSDPPSPTESEKQLQLRYQSKTISGQMLDSEEVIDIISSDSEQAIAPNEQIINTSTQEISTDSDNGKNTSNQTILLVPDDSEDSNSGNEDKLNMCQNLYLSQTQATPELFGSDTDTKVPTKLTREFAGIYDKPFIISKEDACTSYQDQQNLEADIETSS